MGWWTRIWTQRAQDWTYVSFSEKQTPLLSESLPIEPNKAYISIFLRSMRIVNIRKGLGKFYGMAHSYISVPHFSGEKARFHFVAVPSELQNVDPAHLDRVILINKRILGPIPYNGGDIELELGLFSVKSADLAEPFLKVLEGLSNVAGVSLIKAAQPFIEPLLQGVNLLTSTQEDTVLEIGLTKTFDQPKTGYFAVIRAPYGEINPEDLMIQKETYRLIGTASNSPLTQFPYIVISIEASQQRDDWFLIPDLADAYKNLQQKVREGGIVSIKEAQAVFNRTACTCQDLIPDDSQNLVKKVNKYVDKAFNFTLTSGSNLTLPDLKDILLYEETSDIATRSTKE